MAEEPAFLGAPPPPPTSSDEEDLDDTAAPAPAPASAPAASWGGTLFPVPEQAEPLVLRQAVEVVSQAPMIASPSRPAATTPTAAAAARGKTRAGPRASSTWVGAADREGGPVFLPERASTGGRRKKRVSGTRFSGFARQLSPLRNSESPKPTPPPPCLGAAAAVASQPDELWDDVLSSNSSESSGSESSECDGYAPPIMLSKRRSTREFLAKVQTIEKNIGSHSLPRSSSFDKAHLFILQGVSALVKQRSPNTPITAEMVIAKFKLRSPLAHARTAASAWKKKTITSRSKRRSKWSRTASAPTSDLQVDGYLDELRSNRPHANSRILRRSSSEASSLSTASSRMSFQSATSGILASRRRSSAWVRRIRMGAGPGSRGRLSRTLRDSRGVFHYGLGKQEAREGIGAVEAKLSRRETPLFDHGPDHEQHHKHKKHHHSHSKHHHSHKRKSQPDDGHHKTGIKKVEKHLSMQGKVEHEAKQDSIVNVQDYIANGVYQEMSGGDERQMDVKSAILDTEMEQAMTQMMSEGEQLKLSRAAFSALTRGASPFHSKWVSASAVRASMMEHAFTKEEVKMLFAESHLVQDGKFSAEEFTALCLRGLRGEIKSLRGQLVAKPALVKGISAKDLHRKSFSLKRHKSKPGLRRSQKRGSSRLSTALQRETISEEVFGNFDEGDLMGKATTV